jgi:hypothetical protein
MMMMMMLTREGAGALDRLRGDDPRRGGGCDAHARHVTENPQAPGGRHLECPSSGCFFLARSPSASQVSYHVRPAHLLIRKSTFPRSDCFEIQIPICDVWKPSFLQKRQFRRGCRVMTKLPDLFSNRGERKVAANFIELQSRTFA